MPPKKNKKLPAGDGWRNSKAKLCLRELIDAGEIDEDSDPEDAYFLCLREYPEEFEYYDYHDNDFPGKLKSLFNTWTEDTKKAVFDEKAFAHDMKLFPPNQINSRGEPRWEGSEAEAFLREDFAAGKHKANNIKPRDFQKTRPEYLEHDKDSFRDHIYQEDRRIRYNNYLNDKREEKASLGKGSS
jgi:hypothetical protein